MATEPQTQTVPVDCIICGEELGSDWATDQCHA